MLAREHADTEGRFGLDSGVCAGIDREKRAKEIEERRAMRDKAGRDEKRETRLARVESRDRRDG
jgi:hypothetical protein